MNIAENVMEDQEMDDHFNRLMKTVEKEGYQFSFCDQGSGGNELEWWLNEYPTLNSAEAEILERYKKIKNINKCNYKSYVDYMSEIATLDREIMMLEMTIDYLYKDWKPQGESHSNFSIGTIFRTSSGRWLCTDVGARVIVAIRYTPSNPEDMDGPPYMCVEHVFDEYDLQGLTILTK